MFINFDLFMLNLKGIHVAIIVSETYKCGLTWL
jgi:hypothetical protein